MQSETSAIRVAVRRNGGRSGAAGTGVMDGRASHISQMNAKQTLIDARARGGGRRAREWLCELVRARSRNQLPEKGGLIVAIVGPDPVIGRRWLAAHLRANTAK